MYAVGHAHIDSAWLCPARETVRKCARTFSTALGLLERYPDYHFVCSQAQQQAWMKERYPELFARMQERVAKGDFESIGSMWVEFDCNVPSGESLARQFLYGKKFFLDNLRDGDGRVLVARRLRVPGQPPPDHLPDRFPCIRKAEAVVERGRRLSPPQLLVGGYRCDAGARPFPTF